MAAKWTQHLSVYRTNGPIRVASEVCFGNFNGSLPDDLLQDGIDDVDIVILVSAYDMLITPGADDLSRVCNNRSLAVATSCVLDQFDRPIIGFINFCLPLLTLVDGNGSVATNKKETIDNNFEKTVYSNVTVDDTMVIALHEVGHVLGFDSHLFLFYRDKVTGEPLTPRPFQPRTVKCIDGSSKVIVFPSTSTLKLGTTTRGILYYDVVTPTVATVVRNDFNCQSLDGARLENQENGCVSSHWDERLFFTEAMGPIFYEHGSYLSPLTLALMEDTGWYARVSYKGASISPFGRGRGCDFVNGDCIVNDKVPEFAKGAFCDNPIVYFEGQLESTQKGLTCDPTNSFMALCELYNKSSDLPADIVSKLPDDPFTWFSDVNLVGRYSQTDFCPVPVVSIGVDCTSSSTTYTPSYLGETTGINSRCVDGYVSTLVASRATIKAPTCMPVSCDEANAKVVIGEGDYAQTCHFDGDILSVRDSTTGYLICPDFATICPQLVCPSSCSGRGTCDFSYRPAKCLCFDEFDTSNDCGYMVPTMAPIYGTVLPTSPILVSPSRGVEANGTRSGSTEVKVNITTLLTIVLLLGLQLF
jgi:Leishmanolysin